MKKIYSISTIQSDEGVLVFPAVRRRDEKRGNNITKSVDGCVVQRHKE